MRKKMSHYANHQGTTNGRRGFTLVELTVVIAIMAVLLGMAIMIIPGVLDGQDNTRAATQLQQWIEIAKQRAAQDGVPRGIRLVYNPPPSGASTQVQFQYLTRVVSLEYIEQPDSYNLGSSPPSPPILGAPTQPLMPSIATAIGNTVKFTQNDRSLTGGLGGVAAFAPPVLGGDYIELAGVIYKISVTPTIGTQLTLTGAGVPTPVKTANYRILRRPRPIGDDPMVMPQDIVIDVMPRFIGIPATTPLPWPPGPYDLFSSISSNGLPNWSPDQNDQSDPSLDIMFAPDGHVIPTLGNNLAAKDKIILWVRDVDSNAPSSPNVPTNGYNGFSAVDSFGNALPANNTMNGNPTPLNPTGLRDASQPVWGKNEPTLVVIYPRTGLIAAYPVDTNWSSPYTFTSVGQR